MPWNFHFEVAIVKLFVLWCIYYFLLNNRGFIYSSNCKSRSSTVSELNLIQWFMPCSLYFVIFLAVTPVYLTQGHLVAFPSLWIPSFDSLETSSPGTQHWLLLSDHKWFIVALSSFFQSLCVFVLQTSFRGFLTETFCTMWVRIQLSCYDDLWERVLQDYRLGIWKGTKWYLSQVLGL